MHTTLTYFLVYSGEDFYLSLFRRSRFWIEVTKKTKKCWVLSNPGHKNLWLYKLISFSIKLSLSKDHKENSRNFLKNNKFVVFKIRPAKIKHKHIDLHWNFVFTCYPHIWKPCLYIYLRNARCVLACKSFETVKVFSQISLFVRR